MKKISNYTFVMIKSFLFFIVALTLVLIDRFWDYHISGILFFSILSVIALPVIIYKTLKSSIALFLPYILICLLFIYVSVYYIFVPACTVHHTVGILKFLGINLVFVIVSLIASGIAVGIPDIILADIKSKILTILIYCFGAVLMIASILILLSLAQILLIWGFGKEYAEVITNGSPGFMVSIMKFIFY